MDKKEDRENVEKTLEELNLRFLDRNGDIRGLDEVIDEILGKHDEKKKRYFSRG